MKSKITIERDSIFIWCCNGMNAKRNVGGALSVVPTMGLMRGEKMMGGSFYYAEAAMSCTPQYALLHTILDALKTYCKGKGYHVRAAIEDYVIIQALQTGEYEEYERLGFLVNQSGVRYEPSAFFQRCGDLIKELKDYKDEHDIELDLAQDEILLTRKYRDTLKKKLEASEAEIHSAATC